MSFNSKIFVNPEQIHWSNVTTNNFLKNILLMASPDSKSKPVENTCTLHDQRLISLNLACKMSGKYIKTFQ